jgi:hypothetical protein
VRVRVEVLVIDGCRGAELALSRLRIALLSTDRPDIEVGVRTIIDGRRAESSGFAGSPTFTVDGIDLFPGGARTPCLACRVYMTPDGLAAVPTTEQLVERIRAHG